MARYGVNNYQPNFGRPLLSQPLQSNGKAAATEGFDDAAFERAFDQARDALAAEAVGSQEPNVEEELPYASGASTGNFDYGGYGTESAQSDYYAQLDLLEQHNKRRLMQARGEQETHNLDDLSPAEMMDQQVKVEQADGDRDYQAQLDSLEWQDQRSRQVEAELAAKNPYYQEQVEMLLRANAARVRLRRAEQDAMGSVHDEAKAQLVERESAHLLEVERQNKARHLEMAQTRPPQDTRNPNYDEQLRKIRLQMEERQAQAQIKQPYEEKFEEKFESDPTAEELLRANESTEDQQMRDPEEHDDDALAMTAQELLEKVDHNQTEKFRNSQFLALMRKLRDREVKVEGDKMVETVRPSLNKHLLPPISIPDSTYGSGNTSPNPPSTSGSFDRHPRSPRPEFDSHVEYGWEQEHQFDHWESPFQ